MVPMTLDTPVTALPTVRGKAADGLRRLGIRTVRNLLFHFPVRHDDRRIVTPIKEAVLGTPVVIRGTVKEIVVESGFRRLRGRARRVLLTRAVVADASGEISVLWFHQRFIARQFAAGTPAYLIGSVTLGDRGPSPRRSWAMAREGGFTLVAPDIERAAVGKTPIHAARLVPIYPETSGVTSRLLRFLVHRALPLTDALTEYLPAETRESEELPPIGEAVRMMHFPATPEELTRARERLAFDELFLLQLASFIRRRARMAEDAVPMTFADDTVADAVGKLPFALTPSQSEALKEILEDLRKRSPMQRLLAGDVGSGKTVVAGLAALAVARAGGQTAFVAPTEILAVQHAETLASFFAPLGFRVALLTGSREPREKAEILAQVRDGTCDCLVGTHALFHADLQFRKLALVIVDEQHRFGVEQRAELTHSAGGGTPHFLSLTATPIPRTLQLTAYGDVDVTLLEPRPGQQRTRTEVVPPDERNTVYASLANRMRAGEQVFVICPRVEPRAHTHGDDSDGISRPHARGADPRTETTFSHSHPSGLWCGVEEGGDERRSVIAEFERLRKDIFPTFRVGMLHGKLSSDKKQRTLEAFRRRELDVLVSSSVVEVGVDIPNATALLIEGAERFGLAQLHQFRGRVGRRGQAAICYLAATDGNAEALDRLRVLERSSEGLEIAEEDLRRRGAGEIYGTRQSGGVRLRVASLTDIPFLKRVRAAVESLLREDPEVKTAPLLARRVAQLNVTTHFE